MAHQPAALRWSMPLVVSAMLILCILPTSWLGWTSWFGAQAWVVVSPIAHPISMARNVVLPESVQNAGASERERTLAQELSLTRTLLLRERQENTRLTGLVDRLSRGAALSPDVDVTQIQRPVIGAAREFMVVRTGNTPLVERSTIAVVDAVQLCGRVTESGPRTSMVLPFNSRSASPIMGTVLLDQSGSSTVRCLLRPVGDGSLRGDVTQPQGDDEIRVGHEVRLLDDQWPRHAQMLLLGKIERVTQSPDQPLRLQIVVRPTVDLRSVSDVIFRVPDFGLGDTP